MTIQRTRELKAENKQWDKKEIDNLLEVFVDLILDRAIADYEKDYIKS